LKQNCCNYDEADEMGMTDEDESETEADVEDKMQ